MDVTLLKIAAIFYLLATAGYIVYLVLQRGFFSRLAPVLLLFGFLVHTLALAVHFFQTGFPAVTQLREAISLYSWLMVGAYLLVQLKYHLTVLGSIIAPLAFLISLAGFTLGAAPSELSPELKTYWLAIHVTLALLGNAVFALAFGVSVIYLLQQYELKKKRNPVLFKSFPSLETLDRLNYVLLVWGFPLMTLGIITGTLWAGTHWGEYWSWEPRQISSGITWLLYGALLHGRVTAGLRGRKAALWTIVGFAVVLGYFLLGASLFPTRHGGKFD
ncbi:MAG: cytochrome c biogenesis protein CcsA [Deltaproteobacteria bacterium]|nr:cytochrome c biogenesis protein CcsA [Deltaproteobacteria bacterium]